VVGAAVAVDRVRRSPGRRGADRRRDRGAERRRPRRSGEDPGDPLAAAHGHRRPGRRRLQDRGPVGEPQEAARPAPHRADAPGVDRGELLGRQGRLECPALLGPSRARAHLARRGQGAGARVRHRGPPRRLAREGAQGRVPRHRGRRRHGRAQAQGHPQGRRHAVRVPRPRRLAGDPSRHREPRARRRAGDRDGPRGLRAGRGRADPVLDRVRAEGSAARPAHHGGAGGAERPGGRRPLPLPPEGGPRCTRHPPGPALEAGRRGRARHAGSAGPATRATRGSSRASGPATSAPRR
jgi:hypothetical protein